MDSRLILVVIGMIAATFGRSEAIMCYDCSGVNEGYCLDPFKSHGVPLCTGATCTKGKASHGGVTAVVRGCHSDPTDIELCTKGTTPEGIKGKGCICRTDYCNDGHVIKPTAYNVIIGVAMATVVSIAWMNQI